VRVEKTSDFHEHSGVDMPQLDDDLPQTNYMDDLVNMFMDQ